MEEEKAGGVGRSASVVVAWAMGRWGWGVEEAVEWVRESRVGVCPNPGVLRKLHEWEDLLKQRKET